MMCSWWHVDLFTRLLEQRSTSLAVFHGMPPLSYAHILSPLQDVAREAHRMANKHWKILLEAEGASLEGVQIHALKHMHWRLNPLMRVLLMAFEEDEKKTCLLFWRQLCQKIDAGDCQKYW